MKKTIVQPHKSSLGMEANIASLVVFVATLVVAWIPYVKWVAWGVPIAFFFLEKNSGFVKFQSVYAMIIGIINAALSLIIQIFIWILTPRTIYDAARYLSGRGWGAWVVLGIVSTIISILITILTIYMIVMAYGYKEVELPGIGSIARKASEKLNSMNFNKQGPGQPNPNQYNQPQYQQPPYQQAPGQPNQPPYQQAPGQGNQPPYQPPPGQ